jgi:hypothetical protein
VANGDSVTEYGMAIRNEKDKSSMGYEIGTLRIYKGGVSVYVLAVSNLLQEVLLKIVFEYVEHCRRQYFPENELATRQ